jgi:hypothetical protein
MPEDMVTMSVGFTKSQVLDCDLTTQARIIATWKDMHPDDVFEYNMKKLATSVHGIRTNDKFYIWTGAGANSKGLTKTIFIKAFCDYFNEPGQIVFASRDVSRSCLSSELAKLKIKRLCMTSECETVNGKLRVCVLKQCTDHDKIQAR